MTKNINATTNATNKSRLTADRMMFAVLTSADTPVSKHPGGFGLPEPCGGQRLTVSSPASAGSVTQ
jgi:hypothetical protein